MDDEMFNENEESKSVDDDPFFSEWLSRGGKIIERKHVSIKYSGEYLHWLAESLNKSFKCHRRPSLRLLNELIPVLMEASAYAEKGDETAACDALLCGFGLKSATGRRPAAPILEVVNRMDQLLISKQEISVTAAASVVAEEYGIGVSTAKRYWNTYKEQIKNYHG